jgi:hypothetical protein
MYRFLRRNIQGFRVVFIFVLRQSMRSKLTLMYVTHYRVTAHSSAIIPIPGTLMIF